MEGFAGKVAVVTGAGSGIGQALAIELARSGAKVAISDVDTDGLADTEHRLKAISTPVKTDRLDVTEREAFLAYADAVNEHFGTVNQIYNNAGIAFTGDIEVSQFKDIERVMDVDFWGVVNGTKAFLPHLIASGDGHVINISSVFGLFSAPGQAAYNSAKFAVRGFTEALRQEMALAGHPVKVTTVHPGGVKTAIARNATAAEGLDQAELAETFDKRVAHLSPQRAAQIILTGWPRQGPGVGGCRRQGTGPGGPADRFRISADLSDHHRPVDTPPALTAGEESAPEGCSADAVCHRVDPDARGGSTSQRVFGEPAGGHRRRVGPRGHLAAHPDQGRGVQHAGDLVDGQQLPLGQRVATIQRNDVLGPDQRGLAVGQHDQVRGDVGVGGGGPGRDQLSGPQRGEHCCVIPKLTRGGQPARSHGRGCVGAGNAPDQQPAAVAGQLAEIAAAPGLGGGLSHHQRGFVFCGGGVVACGYALGKGRDDGAVYLGIRAHRRIGLQGLQHLTGESGYDGERARVQFRHRVGGGFGVRRKTVRPQRRDVDGGQQHRLGVRRGSDHQLRVAIAGVGRAASHARHCKQDGKQQREDPGDSHTEVSEPIVTATDAVGTGLRVLGPIHTVGAGIQANTQCTVKQRDTLRADPLVNLAAREAPRWSI